MNPQTFDALMAEIEQVQELANMNLSKIQNRLQDWKNLAFRISEYRQRLVKLSGDGSDDIESLNALKNYIDVEIKRLNKINENV